ncbi:MAG: hypothetical protein ACRD2X_08655, partial [Vicinamibacteraceae bacterium]
MISRRTMFALMAWPASAALTHPVRSIHAAGLGQGVSTRGVRPQPRGTPSGRPVLARFTDIAKQAGLTHPIVYGGADTKRYII